MSELVKAELLATCNAIGSLEGNKVYYKDPDCLASLTDLIRFLKHDDDNHEIRRHLGQMKVLQSDLIYLFKSLNKNEKQLQNILIRLMVDLTMPAMIVCDGELPTDSISRRNYMQIESYLEGYKLAFCEEDVWGTCYKLLRDFLSLEWENKSEEDGLFIERLLVLIRNILHIPANEADELRTDDDFSFHDRILWALHQSGVDDLVLFIANSDEYNEFSLHSIEIICLMLRQQDPGQLVGAGSSRSLSEKQKDEAALVEIRQKESEEKRRNMFRQCSTRHSRFGGTFCVKDVKSISDQDLIVHKPIKDLKNVNFDTNKNRHRKAINKRPVIDTNVYRSSTLGIRLFLRDFCVEFLSSAYNSIMNTVKDQLNRSRDKGHDESYYLSIMRFFMEFNRLGTFKVDLVSETMSISTFHFIQTQLETYIEMMKTDKPKWLLWSKRMHIAFRAYKELILTLQAMDGVNEESVRSSAKVIKSNLFYMVEYRDLPCELFSKYNEIIMPKTYLRDLVETTHVFLKMLENHVKVYSQLVVQKKKRKTTKRKKTGQSTKQSAEAATKEAEKSVDDIWEKISSDLRTCLRGECELPEGIIPFDAASEVPVDDQKEIAVRRIQGYLQSELGAQAVSLLRASREVWPEGDVFGAAVTDDDAELSTLKEILMAQLPGGAIRPPPVTVPGGSVLEEELEEAEHAVEDASEEEEDVVEEEWEGPSSGRSEQQLDLKAFIMKFANPKALRAYSLLLHTFATNSTFTNHCIVKMLHRIAWDCKMIPLLFQLSLFKDFQAIFNSTSQNTAIKELRKFATFVLRKFFEVAERNKIVFAELLFWKVPAAAYEIEEGYGTYQAKQFTSQWSDQQNEELKSLYDKYRDRNEPGADVVDLIFENLSEKGKTRRQIIGQLKRLELVNISQSFKKKSGVVKRAAGEWTEEELSEMKQLYERFQEEADDVVARIVDNLSVKRPKARVIEKLVEIGVVADKSQLRKKFNKTINKKIRQRKSADEVEEVSTNDISVDGGGEDGGTQPLEYVILLASSKNELLGSIKWIADDLKDIADDRQTGGDEESVPLVPIMRENHDALENPIFIRLLKALGLQVPQTGHETYWRYPARLSAEVCRKRAKMLQEAFDENSDARLSRRVTTESESSDSDDDHLTIDFAPIEKTSEIAETHDDDYRDVKIATEEELVEKPPSVIQDKRKFDLLSDDEEAEKSVPKKGRKTFVIDSDSE